MQHSLGILNGVPTPGRRRCQSIRRSTDQSQILLCHEHLHALRQIGIASDLERTAAIDSKAQSPEKGNASRTSFDMRSHLFAGAQFNARVQVLGQIRK